jgi:predicted DNA-binding mobile mystery protein A
MKKLTQKLLLEQMEKKMALLKPVAQIDPPTGGWIRALRTSLNMSLRQYAKRMGLAAPNIKAIEQREELGTVSLNTLRSAAHALNLKFVYGFVPMEGSLNTMIDKQATKVSKAIVMRTDATMKLEDQQVKKERLEKAVAALADELKREMPRYLWD